MLDKARTHPEGRNYFPWNSQRSFTRYIRAPAPALTEWKMNIPRQFTRTHFPLLTVKYYNTRNNRRRPHSWDLMKNTNINEDLLFLLSSLRPEPKIEWIEMIIRKSYYKDYYKWLYNLARWCGPNFLLPTNEGKWWFHVH